MVRVVNRSPRMTSLTSWIRALLRSSAEGGDQQWTRDQLGYGFDQLVNARLLEADADGYRLTSLGRFAGESGVHVDSIIRLSAALNGIDIAGLKSTTIIAAAQLTVEVDGMYMPVNGRRNSPEPQIWTNVLVQQQVDRLPLRALHQTAPDTAAIRAALRKRQRRFSLSTASRCLFWKGI